MEVTKSKDKQYNYVCGPRPFLRTMVGWPGALRRGVEPHRYEFFGPADELLAA